ncbi:MAG: NADPH2:quinone reductase [Halieaceae bacterium]|jgi:NADPH2:quinone reductase
MRAWRVARLGRPEEVIQLEEHGLPEPGPGEIKLSVQAAGVGLPDVLMCRGKYAYKPELPFTPGQEIAGTVISVGEGVSCVPGQRMMGTTAFYRGQGGFAEECMSAEGMLFPTPDEMPDLDAAGFVIPWHTAWIGLVNRGRIKAGNVLVVLGAAGGSGSTAVMLGKALGARVIAVAGGAEKAELCREFGADEVIDYQSSDVSESVMKFTDGQGADLVYDPVGGELGSQMINCLANEGCLLAIGFASGGWATADTASLVGKNISIAGVYVGAYGSEQRRHIHGELLNLYREGKIAPLLDRVVQFEDLPTALADLGARRVRGKLILQV